MLKSDSYLFFKPKPPAKVCQSAVVKIFTKGSNKICGFAYNREKKNKTVLLRSVEQLRKQQKTKNKSKMQNLKTITQTSVTCLMY